MEELYKEYRGKLPKKIIDEIEENVPKNISATKLKKILEAVYQEYKNVIVSAGEAVGVIAAESIGEPGTQMSLDYEEKVIVKSQNKIRIVKIGEFIDKIMAKKVNYASYEHTEMCDLNNAELFAPALSQNEKVEWKKITAISRHKSPNRLLKITTRSGRQITATPYHSFVIRENNQIAPIAGSRLGIGSRIPALKMLVNLANNEFLKLGDYLPKSQYIYESELRKAINKEENFILPIKSYEQINNYAQGNNKLLLKQDCIYTYQHHGNAQIPEVIELDNLFGFFIGAYLAEGTHTKHYAGITNISEQYLQQVIKFAEKYNINYKIKYEIGEYGKSTTLLLYSSLVADLLNKTCGKGAYSKHIPDFAYSAKSEFVSGLLRAYFDGDGNINVLRRVIRASSCSKRLIDGVAMLLAQFGIFATKSANKNQHKLSISYRYAEQFKEKIGSVIDKKRVELNKLVYLNPETTYDLIDMIPGFGNILSKLGRKLGIPSRFTNKYTKKQKIGRQRLKRYISLFEKKAKGKNVLINEELKILKRMLNSDVIWDEIINLEYVKPTKAYVYDFSVEDLETFTNFDGIITHNTLNTFHFAGVAEMNVTLGLPRIIEILDGRKELDMPMMEIYLTKSIAKGRDIGELRKFALSIKETKLEDIALEFAINLTDLTVMVKLDKDKIKDLGLTTPKIAERIAKQTKMLNIKGDGDSIIIKSKSNKDEGFNEVYKIKEKIKGLNIKGIKGINQVLPVKRDDEFVIITAGSNLAEVLMLEDVDSYRTTTNKIFEIEQVLGIEAAREAIIREVFKVIENQGLNVDVRHIMLVADTMCISGTVKGITRYGVVSEKSSVLARASFETPIKNLINAGLAGEVDELNSVVENIMLNQVIPIGTGLPKLVMIKDDKKAEDKK